MRKRLVVRAAVLRAMREFFIGQGFLEVETPSLVQAPGQEPYLQVFQTTFKGDAEIPLFLITSPEHHMKRLLGGGFDRIFQICRCFRNGERSGVHNPEFTMAEWYRAGAEYSAIMDDTENLVAHVTRTVLGTTEIAYQGMLFDLAPPWARLTVRQAFKEFAGISLEDCRGVDEFRLCARACDCHSVSPGDTWEDIFFKIFLEKVEPALRGKGTIFLTEYPASMAAMAKLKESDPTVAERVEAYIAGLELANGFTELNDPQEQRQRFATDRQKRCQAGFAVHPLDGEFLEMLEQGMPPAAGIALGVDRLVMLLTDAAEIADVISFPFDG